MTAPAVTRVGIDLVQISRVRESLAQFGDRFLRRVFTADEVAYATAVASEAPSRLAARFAAKEAVAKALGLPRAGWSWRDVEVRRAPSGDCSIVLHEDARQDAARMGLTEIAVSLSHEGDYATAVVVARMTRSPE